MTISRSGRRWIDQPGSLLALLNVGLGVVLLLGDPLRTSAPSFSAAKEIMPIPAWGLLFLTGAAVCAVASRHGSRGAVLVAVGGGIHAFWAAALLQAALRDSRVAFTGVVVYGWVAALHLTTGIRLARRAS